MQSTCTYIFKVILNLFKSLHPKVCMKKKYHDTDTNRFLGSQFGITGGQTLEMLNTVKFLNFRMPENIVVIYLKFKQRGQILGYFIKKMQME